MTTDYYILERRNLLVVFAHHVSVQKSLQTSWKIIMEAVKCGKQKSTLHLLFS